MNGEVRVMPLGVSIVVGGLDGVIRQGDLAAGKPWWKENSTYFEGAALAVGLGLGLFGRFHADIVEPLMYSSAALLSGKVGAWGAQKLETAPAAAAAGYAGVPAMSELGAAYAAPQLFGRIRQEPVGLTG